MKHANAIEDRAARRRPKRGTGNHHTKPDFHQACFADKLLSQRNLVGSCVCATHNCAVKIKKDVLLILRSRLQYDHAVIESGQLVEVERIR